MNNTLSDTALDFAWEKGWKSPEDLQCLRPLISVCKQMLHDWESGKPVLCTDNQFDMFTLIVKRVEDLLKNKGDKE